MAGMGIEIERRFLVRGVDETVVRASPPIELQQGYLDVPGQLRVRVTTMQEPGRYLLRAAELTQKTGKGIARGEHNADISFDAAQMLLETTPYRIDKTRYEIDDAPRKPWQVDFFHGPLEGLVLVEKELDSVDEGVTLPEWVFDPVDVTETLSNKQLATIACYVENDDSTLASRIRSRTAGVNIPRIVMTGGPCGGKSSILDHIRRSDPTLLCVPETATILMGQIGITPEVGEEAFQRTLYRVQRAFEEGAAKQAQKAGKQAIIFDRGTLDSAAFIGGGVKAYEKMCSTTQDTEFSNYDAVLVLAVPDEATYDANRRSNPVRRETYAQAIEVQRRAIGAWADHPLCSIIDGSWDHKLDLVSRAIQNAKETAVPGKPKNG